MEEGKDFMRAQRKLRLDTSEDLEAPITNSVSKSLLKGLLFVVVVVLLLS